MEIKRILESHFHIWDPQNLNYPWLKGNNILDKPYSVEDFNIDTIGLPIEKIVFVQCECSPEQSGLELNWISQIAKAEKRIQAIIPWAPLELGKDALPYLAEYHKNPLVKGIRRIIQFESDPEFCLNNKFIDGVKLLSLFRFSFDICVSHNQLPKVIDLVKLCPEVEFVLDHFGKPDIKNNLIHEWELNIKSLSSFQNVHCKLSGLLTEADFNLWNINDLIPYLKICLKYFGVSRLMFGGDWPVILQAAEYKEWISIVNELLNGLSETEKDLIFFENGKNFYRID